MAIFAVFLPVLDHSVAKEMSVQNVVTFHFLWLHSVSSGKGGSKYMLHNSRRSGGRGEEAI